MKVKDLLKLLQDEINKNKDFENKKITCYDFANNICYNTPDKPTFLDLSDENYLDIVFNIEDINNE